MGGLHVPFHRATPGGGLQEYVVLSVYVGILHIFVGLFIGLYTVWKAHGAAAAFFEKGSWLLIMTGGTMQARNMVMGFNELFELLGTITKDSVVTRGLDIFCNSPKS